MTILILGGTEEARKLCKSLVTKQQEVIYSVVKLNRRPDVGCEVIAGNFSQFGSLSTFIQNRQVQAILDITDPYAEKISIDAVESAVACNIPCWRFHQNALEPAGNDNWMSFKSWDQMLLALADKKSVFLTAGEIDQFQLHALGENIGKSILYRSVSKPSTGVVGSAGAVETLGARNPIKWLKDIGLNNSRDEWALMRMHNVDVLVSKNIGDGNIATLRAARATGIPVFMLERPELPEADRIFYDLVELENFVLQMFELPLCG